MRFSSLCIQQTVAVWRGSVVRSEIHSERILVLDFGAQYVQLIARRVREAGVYCEIRAYDMSEADFVAFAPKGVILSGGPESVTVTDSPRAPEFIWRAGVPVLGICYGMQTMAVQLGGSVGHVREREFGHARIEWRAQTELSEVDDAATAEMADGADVAIGADVWMSHGDQVQQMPNGFALWAATPSAPIAAMFDASRRYFGVQFHPEVTHTEGGQALINRFVRDVCGCSGLWTAGNIIDDAVARIRAQVGTDPVLLGLSGGVDSSVTAALLARAIGDRLTAIFVDNGLLRLGEGDEVMRAFGGEAGNSLPIRIVRVDAQDAFLSQLQGVTDPEAKRKVIGRVFIEVFEREAKAVAGGAKWLAQGTIYPDVVESAATKHGKAHVIKSHHNVGGLPERMQLGLVEPLRELFKDEVRAVGLALGLPAALINRHPFPGPGLGVRILGEVKREYADVLRRADAIFIEELRRAGWYEQVSQAFAVYLPVKSVGVVGDARRYEHVIALRSVATSDFMTADWSPLPFELLGTVARRIVNEIAGISRVVYDITSKPPGTIEWE